MLVKPFSQFHLHCLRALFVQKAFDQLSSSYNLALVQLFGAKISAKMLMKLTPNWRQILQASFVQFIKHWQNEPQAFPVELSS